MILLRSRTPFQLTCSKMFPVNNELLLNVGLVANFNRSLTYHQGTYLFSLKKRKNSFFQGQPKFIETT